MDYIVTRCLSEKINFLKKLLKIFNEISKKLFKIKPLNIYKKSFARPIVKQDSYNILKNTIYDLHQ